MPNDTVLAADTGLPTEKPDISVWGTICAMEDPLATISDLLTAFALLSVEIEGPRGLVVNRLAHLARDQCEALAAMRGDLFRLSHPSRDHFDKAGWPGQEA